MAKIQIVKKDGTPSRYFWSDSDGSSPTLKRVYRETSTGVRRLRDVRFDSVNKRIRRRRRP